MILSDKSGFAAGLPAAGNGCFSRKNSAGRKTYFIILFMAQSSFIELCRKRVGNAHVISVPEKMASYVTDYRKRYAGKALAVVLPGNTQEVADLVRLCKRHRVPVVPQGGNTGLVLGSVPDASGKAVVLSLARMKRIREIDVKNNTMTVEAGCILDDVHSAALEADRMFPLSLASSGSCTIGGNLAANAGGTAVLRYGTARDLCLGLEVVMADGAVWDGLYKLRKNNTGYDLRDLFIGSEGTLGIITAAVLKLFPRPRTRQTAFVALSSPADALKLLAIAQKVADSSLTTFELMSGYSLELVARHFPHLLLPLPLDQPYYVLMELSGTEPEEQLGERFEKLLQYAIEEGVICDAALAQTVSQSRSMWALRENISAAQAKEGKNIKHDIAVPTSLFAEFIETTDRQLQQYFPGCRMVTFGHLGDGSLHYNVAAPEGVSDDAFLMRQDEVNRIVYDSVNRMQGAISAEHGLGALKHGKNAEYKSEVEIRMMRKIREAFDPDNLMNPGKVLP